jgi:hypothetical protein
MTPPAITSPGLRRTLHWVALFLLLTGAIGTQVVVGGALDQHSLTQEVQWVRSPGLMRRLVLGFDALAADIYWIRAVQYYGSTKLSTAEQKNYDFLYPLLDITTTLDPQFNIAYRFGAILLSEAYPNGAGRPDQAIALLEKGIRESPAKWEYYHDAGFVHYWWRRDMHAAADWFLRASKLPDAPNWLQPLAASILAEGGDQNAARLLWTQLAQNAEHDWMRTTAETRLRQLDAENAIDQLQPLVNRFYDSAGRFPAGWNEVVRAGMVRGIPLDPTGVPFALDPTSGQVDVAMDSALYPLPKRRFSAGSPR